MSIEIVSEQRCHGGTQGIYQHASDATGGNMRFSVFVPPAAGDGKYPALYFLAGLTCTEETFIIKAGAQRLAAELGLVLVAPDTSPRDTGLDGATGDWEFGEGAGFYVDATQAPWSTRFNMHRYVAEELPALVEAHFPVDPSRRGIFGHSMGGHGALTLALRHPGRYRSVSAFAPIVSPAQVPWGRKAFPRYLGEDETTWRGWDATALVEDGHRFDGEILIDQGEADRFLEAQLQPERFASACRDARQALRLRMQAGYDHSYWFIQTFIDDHLRHHARALEG
ncbi:S-formylglutathione hydrolase [Pseudofulvimonas gallinarii]|jgi:S-formylglutathione hydrolase|uniref:S-formylglutathione hydrolase n=1 Tax=Pseudofulvimonas gallinarii TaxID=634155 RepID=A0A4S3L2P6_9GAMM|nr:S-formylglutathione hydrolase [Pseudofulvimonas gallinarii]TCT01327.1 S-formylglutathione hydrolase [Pseudofulvimonas gallinarii]THD15084.1 S-formylglutathione hydrolase [Pseudofulvimonas gallinarii]